MSLEHYVEQASINLQEAMMETESPSVRMALEEADKAVNNVLEEESE